MPAPTLTPAQALSDYQLTVTQVDLDDAENLVYAVTSFTLAEHVDTRKVYSGNVRRAWAIVASRMRESTTGDEARFVTSESERDYSYNENSDLKAAGELSLLAGKPNELLSITATWDSFTESAQDRADQAWSGRRFGYTDSNGVYHRPA